ncbi:hypothetical protein I317_00687 [Kwoniella heveanensis CBS 569]|nr:hypothetical protein I317_00687 [Kwoniella heveanensis CBS 569]
MSYDRGQPRQGCDSSGSDVEKEEGAEGSQAGMQDSPGASWERGRSKASTPFPPSPQQRHLETHLLLTPRAPASLSNLLNLPSDQSRNEILFQSMGAAPLGINIHSAPSTVHGASAYSTNTQII